MGTQDHLKEINEFEALYQYDTTYMREMLESSPEGYDKFADFMPLNNHREKLDIDSFWVAKLAAMQVEDCGGCLQLCVRLALEEGVALEIIKATLAQGEGLPDELRDLFLFAVGVAGQTPADAEVVARVNNRLDKGTLLEIGVCVATAKVFPTIKRALGYIESCQVIEIEV